MARPGRLIRTIVTLALLAYSFTAQVRDRAELVGRVTDSTGAVLHGVDLRFRNEATAHEQMTTTEPTGDFFFPFLPSGTYSLSTHSRGTSVHLAPLAWAEAQQTVTVKSVSASSTFLFMAKDLPSSN